LVTMLPTTVIGVSNMVIPSIHLLRRARCHARLVGDTAIHRDGADNAWWAPADRPMAVDESRTVD
jgi:hypothetical protein